MEFVVEKVEYHQAQTIYLSTPKSFLGRLVSLPGPMKYGNKILNKNLNCILPKKTQSSEERHF